MGSTIKIIKQNNIIRAVKASTRVSFVPFTFTATAGQTTFEFESIPAKVLVVVINGATQNEDAGDFTVVGDLLNLSEGVEAGDKVYGIYQV